MRMTKLHGPVDVQLVPIDELRILLKDKNVSGERLEAIFDRSLLSLPISTCPPPMLVLDVITVVSLLCDSVHTVASRDIKPSR